jgi:hypothetical protein
MIYNVRIASMRSIFLAVTTAVAFSACQTTTRLGDLLIPAHPNSNKAKDEKVEFQVERIAGGGSDFRSGDFDITGAGLSVAKWLADQAQKKVAEELRNEAKKYTQQYSGKLRQAFGPGTYRIAMFRLVPGKSTASVPSGGSLSKMIETKESVRATSAEPMMVASAVLFELSVQSAGKYAFGYLDLREVYLSKAKAKIVGLSAWPWHWLGGILLQTGDLVKMEVHAKVKGLTDKGPTVIIDEDFPGGGQKMKLGKPGIKTNENEGDWLLFGKFGNSVPLTLDVRVTESDPSNVQKVLKDAGDKVEKSSFLQDLIPGGS